MSFTGSVLMQFNSLGFDVSTANVLMLIEQMCILLSTAIFLMMRDFLCSDALNSYYPNAEDTSVFWCC